MMIQASRYDRFTFPHSPMVTLQLNQIEVPAGGSVIFRDVSWPQFEAILEALGDHRNTRIKYYNGQLEIMAPSPEHEINRLLVGDLVVVLLESQDRSFERYGSTTFKKPNLAGIEPDDCFYIQNYKQMIGKTRMNLAIDPPPELAIEVDVTSKTTLEIYEHLGVEEVWQLERGELKIHYLTEQGYQESSESQIFPGKAIVPLINQTLTIAKSEGRSVAVKFFRQQLN